MVGPADMMFRKYLLFSSKINKSNEANQLIDSWWNKIISLYNIDNTVNDNCNNRNDNDIKMNNSCDNNDIFNSDNNIAENNYRISSSGYGCSSFAFNKRRVTWELIEIFKCINFYNIQWWRHADSRLKNDTNNQYWNSVSQSTKLIVTKHAISDACDELIEQINKWNE